MDDIVAYSRDRIERGSKSFAGAARLFDEDTRASAYMLYAWCRHCDDEIDGQDHGYVVETAAPSGLAHSPEAAQGKLDELFAKTRAALDGDADEPVYRALSRVVEKHNIPHIHPLELLDGFRMDVDGHRYASLQDTLDYSYHVAGVVGVMMAMIMGVRDRATLNRASDLGIAFQLTNIARDVVPDAQAGRCYLPEDWRAEAGLSLANVADPKHREAVFQVTARLLDVADQYYASARVGIAHLPPRAAWAIAAARNVYRDIGRVIRDRGAGAWDERAHVGRARKLAQVALGGWQAAGAKLGTRGTLDDRDRAGLWTHPALGEARALAMPGRVLPGQNAASPSNQF